MEAARIGRQAIPEGAIFGGRYNTGAQPSEDPYRVRTFRHLLTTYGPERDVTPAGVLCDSCDHRHRHGWAFINRLTRRLGLLCGPCATS